MESEEQNELNNIDGIQFTQNLKVISFTGDKNKEFLDLNQHLRKFDEISLSIYGDETKFKIIDDFYISGGNIYNTPGVFLTS